MLEQFEGAATVDKIAALCRRRGFVFPSSDIYGGLGSAYDYGHYGVLLKQNVKGEWQRSMIQERDDMVALDSAIILNPQVWVASGHVGGFSDPLVDCRTCKLRFRADDLEHAQCGKRPSKHPGEDAQCDLTEAREFNLMFETHVGPLRDSGSTAYLRPETAQGIFVNFKNVTSSLRVKPPFGVAQIGKSFRNEITPGNFIFRLREFEQMEMEFFVPPADAAEWHAYWIEERRRWHLSLGLRESHLRVRAHDADELSHYSSATSDLEYLFPIGWLELEGIANRGDYDLAQHQKFSGEDLTYFDQEHDERYLPYVIEPALGADRSTLAFLLAAYDEDEATSGEGKVEKRTVLRLDPRLAPIKVAVLPLSKKDTLLPLADEVADALRPHFQIDVDLAGAIGRRYRRQDEIGTPLCVTIDFETIDDRAVTVRDRDTMAQERIPLDRLVAELRDRLGVIC
jgi:glycyl-tRNA synthetase